MQTYLLDNIEVKTTGRTADKMIMARRNSGDDKVLLLHEVTPVDNEQGSWKKWVNLDELFVVREK